MRPVASQDPQSPRTRRRPSAARLRPRTPVEASAISSPNQLFRCGSDFGKGNAIENDTGWDGDVEALQYRRHQIYCTKRSVRKSHAGCDRDLHMFRNETPVAGPVLRDFPRATEIGTRRGRQDEITGPGRLEKLKQLTGRVRHVALPCP